MLEKIGRIQATFEVVFLTGWAPGPDQPEPMRPGSAKMRLADALGTKEHSAGDRASPTAEVFRMPETLKINDPEK